MPSRSICSPHAGSSCAPSEGGHETLHLTGRGHRAFGAGALRAINVRTGAHDRPGRAYGRGTSADTGRHRVARTLPACARRMPPSPAGASRGPMSTRCATRRSRPICSRWCTRSRSAAPTCSRTCATAAKRESYRWLASETYYGPSPCRHRGGRRDPRCLRHLALACRRQRRPPGTAAALELARACAPHPVPVCRSRCGWRWAKAAPFVADPRCGAGPAF